MSDIIECGQEELMTGTKCTLPIYHTGKHSWE